MALIIETGAVVANANSFTTDAEFTARATLVGITLPTTLAERDALQIQAVTYITGKEPKMSGTRTNFEQELPYPRRGAVLHGTVLDSNKIPQQLKLAQLELALQAASGALFTTSASSGVKREKLDVMEVEYFEGSTGSEIVTGKADSYLAQLYETAATSSAGGGLTRV